MRPLAPHRRLSRMPRLLRPRTFRARVLRRSSAPAERLLGQTRRRFSFLPKAPARLWSRCLSSSRCTPSGSPLRPGEGLGVRSIILPIVAAGYEPASSPLARPSQRFSTPMHQGFPPLPTQKNVMDPEPEGRGDHKCLSANHDRSFSRYSQRDGKSPRSPARRARGFRWSEPSWSPPWT
jgi:hypothetical protein